MMAPRLRGDDTVAFSKIVYDSKFHGDTSTRAWV